MVLVWLVCAAGAAAQPEPGQDGGVEHQRDQVLARTAEQAHARHVLSDRQEERVVPAEGDEQQERYRDEPRQPASALRGPQGEQNRQGSRNETRTEPPHGE